MSFLLLNDVVIFCKILIFRVLIKYFNTYFADNQLFIFLSCTKENLLKLNYLNFIFWLCQSKFSQAFS
jgi:hypothetical protein